MQKRSEKDTWPQQSLVSHLRGVQELLNTGSTLAMSVSLSSTCPELASFYSFAECLSHSRAEDEDVVSATYREWRCQTTDETKLLRLKH